MQPLTGNPMVLPALQSLGRYEIIAGLGRGGMATVYLGRSAGEAGFHRLFAIKLLHPHLADDQEFVAMLLDEARIAARLHHPNVVPIVDLGSQDGAHYVAMEYVEGCALSALLSKHRDNRPPRLLVPVILDALSGLHAAHTLTDDDGQPMNLVHRDVSPQNILVGVDGNARITDFGIARAESRINSTLPGQVKGKIAYMSPEQIRGVALDCRSDIFSAGCMLWSCLTGRRLFVDTSDAATMNNILQMEIPPPSTVGLHPPVELDAVCMRALERNPDKRFASALEMEEALREAATAAKLLGSKREVAEWISASFGEELTERRKAVRAALSRRDHVAPTSQPSISGFRMIPSVGEATPSDFDAAGNSRTPATSQTLPAMGAPRGGARRGLLAAAAGLGLVFAGVGAWLVLHSPPAAHADLPATTSASVAPPVPGPDTATAATGATVTSPAPPPTGADPVPPDTAATTTPTAPVTALPAPVKRVVIYTRPAPHRPPPPAASASAAAPPPTRTWDKDSPLPPQ